MGFLDRAKKLADQAREKAEDALAEARSRAESMTSKGSSGGASQATGGDRDPRWGTPYVPGMLGRPGWRERGLTDPAAVLPIAERDAAGVPHTTKSEVVEEPYGMGRRWSAGGRVVGLFYQLYPEQRAWDPPAGRGADATAKLPDGRSLVFIGAGDHPVVLEAGGLDDATVAALARSVADHLDR